MQRSPAQILFRFLPDAVFSHEQGFIAKVHRVAAEPATVNRQNVLNAVGEAFDQWQQHQRSAPDPRSRPSEYVLLTPKQVLFDIYPLTFVCKNVNCGRVQVFYRQDAVVSAAAGGRLVCAHCSSKVRQLRYVTAHECGDLKSLYVPSCKVCNSKDDISFIDVGTFSSSAWKCRACGWSQGTRFTSCSCNRYQSPGKATSYMRGYTERDSRLWCPQILTLLNIQSSVYEDLQQSEVVTRGIVALSSWLDDETNISSSLKNLTAGNGSRQRLSAEQWADEEAKLRDHGLAEALIDQLRDLQGPVTTGTGALPSQVTPVALEHAAQTGFVERAGLFDKSITNDRKTLGEVSMSTAVGPQQRAVQGAIDRAAAFGVDEISVTQKFPILMASFGFQRGRREPGQADLMMYQRQRQYDNKNAIFTVPAETEALIVTVDASKVLGFLGSEGKYDRQIPSDQRAARIDLLELFASDLEVDSDSAAATARRLVHTMSHALLRALDDGQSGFGESSLAEWIVPDALTFAVYVASYNAFTLGAFDTVLRRRVSSWLDLAVENVQVCDNDPMCGQQSSQKPHAACDRCLHTSFGCQVWNSNLDRLLLRRFWQWTS